jgi:hypothetical protein
VLEDFYEDGLLLFPFRKSREPVLGRTDMEGGPPKQAPLKSRGMVTRSVTYFFESRDFYEDFVEWFTEGIHNGADWFTWTDPEDGVEKPARIPAGGLKDETPRRKDLDRWQVQFDIETWG